MKRKWDNISESTCYLLDFLFMPDTVLEHSTSSQQWHGQTWSLLSWSLQTSAHWSVKTLKQTVTKLLCAACVRPIDVKLWLQVQTRIWTGSRPFQGPIIGNVQRKPLAFFGIDWIQRILPRFSSIVPHFRFPEVRNLRVLPPIYFSVSSPSLSFSANFHCLSVPPFLSSFL